MTITGIIAEFNPFHNGHKYLLEQTKGLKIVAMSGNFMQRGEPAIVDKWTRAQMALENGADLVVELPFLVSVQAADFFGQGLWISWLGWVLIASLLEQKKFWIIKKSLTYTQSKVERWRILWKICLILSPIPRKPKPCGRNLLVLIFQAIHPIMFLLWPMPRRLRDEISSCIRFSVRGLVTILWTRMWTSPRRQPSVSTKGTKIS